MNRHSGDLARQVDCPQCGAASDVPSGDRFYPCPFCDATLFVDRSGVVQHYELPRLLDAEQALAALKRWMAGNDTVKDLDRKSAIGVPRSISFPMWTFRAQVRGGEEFFVEPAAPTPVPQLADLKIPAGKLLPYRGVSDGSEVVDATIPLEVAREWLEQRGVGATHETALIRVPLWRFEYSFSGSNYQALVEASTGEVLAAVFPEKSEAPYYLVGILGALLFGIEGLLISNLIVKLLAYSVTAVPLTLIAYLVTRKV